MFKFDCSVLGDRAEVDIIQEESVTRRGPGPTGLGPPGPIGIMETIPPRIDCRHKFDCGLTDPNTGLTDWDRCPASVEFTARDTLEYLPGIEIIEPDP